MHELGITDQLLRLTLRHAEQAGASRVISLNLVIGEFSSVVDESIQFYWDMLAAGTIAEKAILHFERVPGVLQCLSCEHTFSLGEFHAQCPSCGGVRTRVADGDQFRLASIEVEGPQGTGDHGSDHQG